MLIVEDEPQFRQTLLTHLSRDGDIVVAGEAATGEEAVEQAAKVSPDVVLMDIELGAGMTGIQAGHAIKAKRPSTGIVLLSNHKAKQFVVTMAGWSYLLKRNVRDINFVARAVKGAAWGLLVIDPQVTEALTPREGTPLSRLLPLELKALELLAQGFGNDAIAREMQVSRETVEALLAEVFRKLDAGPGDNARVAAVRMYFDQTRSI